MAKSKHTIIGESNLADTQKNVAFALTHIDGVSIELAIALARNNVTAEKLKDKGLDELTMRYGLTAQEADKVMKGAQKGLPEGIEGKLDFVPAPVSDEETEDGSKKAQKPTRKGS